MFRIILFLAIVFSLAGLFLNGPLPSSEGRQGARFAYTIGEPRATVTSYDVSPVVGVVVVVGFLYWFQKKGGR